MTRVKCEALFSMEKLRKNITKLPSAAVVTCTENFNYLFQKKKKKKKLLCGNSGYNFVFGSLFQNAEASIK